MQPDYEPGWLRHEGRVVLDQSDVPIRDFDEISLCLSSSTPGYKLEYISKLNLEIEQQDRQYQLSISMEQSANKTASASSDATNGSEATKGR